MTHPHMKGRSFFGGDTGKAHFTTGLATPKDRANAVKRREQNAALKAAGFKVRYFQYTRGDRQAESLAKAQCTRYAQTWTRKTGITLEVVEGMFL